MRKKLLCKTDSFCIILIMLMCLMVRTVLAQPVSINAVDCEIHDVLFGLARQCGMNLLIDESVKGRLTLRLDNVEFNDAIRLITMAKGIEYQQENEHLYIVSSKLSKQAYIIPLANLTKEQALQDAAALLGGSEADKSLAYDDINNTLLYFGSGKTAEQLKTALQQLDKEPQQVMLEARVLSLENSAAKKLGIEWDWQRGSDSPGMLKLGHSYETDYLARLEALVSQGKAEVLAKPNVIAMDSQEAQINIGGSVPVPTVTSNNVATTTSLEYHDVGIILKYTPRIGAEGKVLAAVHIEVSSPMYVEAMQAYKFNKRSVDTTVRMLDGETMVIGGLIGREESESLSRVPFLSDIPILGKFFIHKEQSRQNSEIVIFLKANIVG